MYMRKNYENYHPLIMDPTVIIELPSLWINIILCIWDSWIYSAMSMCDLSKEIFGSDVLIFGFLL